MRWRNPSAALELPTLDSEDKTWAIGYLTRLDRWALLKWAEVGSYRRERQINRDRQTETDRETLRQRDSMVQVLWAEAYLKRQVKKRAS